MFLKKLLPPEGEGLYCVAELLSSGKFKHWFFDTIEATAAHAERLDGFGRTVYVAQAVFHKETIEAALAHNANRQKTERKKERSQDNAVSLKNFFLDIDCGEKWPLKNQREGAAALRQFVQETGLPMPTVVNSGNGLYAHWLLTEAISEQQWKTVARVLKKVVAAYSPAIGGDASRTSDSASVLRPPGTTNRKPGKDPKPVTIIIERPEVDFLEFARQLGEAAKKKRIDRTVLQPPKPSDDLNAEFLVQHETVLSSPDKVADACAQLGVLRSSQGNVTEPLWYACLGLLLFCEAGEETAHAWSSGHPEYSHEQTAAKLQQWQDTGMGPTTCAKFGEVNPNGCVGCPNVGQIKSPIVLGRPEPEQLALPEEQCPPPPGYKRANDGLHVEKDGRWIKFYDRDLWIDKLAYDESLGYEVMVIKHHLPFDGELECTLRSSLVNDPKNLLMALADAHIKVVGQQEKKIMVAYMESYQHTLQRHRRMTMLLCQMGWKELRGEGKPMFVLGRKIFHVDGSTEDASLARNVPRSAEGFRICGELAPWVAATKHLGEAGMEPFAFALLAGGFGAVLMKYTGFAGAMVSMVGQSGAGKTLMLRWIASVWGYHSDLIMLRNDTRNATISRLGVYNNLPLCIDEVTNISAADASDLAYQITQGKDKARLNRNSEEKRNINKWNTLAVTSSNSSLIDLLSAYKQNSEAELNRIFEYEVKPQAAFSGKVTSQIYWALDTNYGVAGEVYARWLVQHIQEVRTALEKTHARIEREASLKGDERFWGAIASVAIVGGLIASKLGLIQFEVTPVYNWLINRITNMRAVKVELNGSAIDTLARFINEHANNKLVVIKRNAQEHVLEHPRGALNHRLEPDRRKLYISRSAMQSWIGKCFGSYSKTRADLVEVGVLVNANARKSLGAGTFYAGGLQACWEINIDAPALQESGMPQFKVMKDGSDFLTANMEALV